MSDPPSLLNSTPVKLFLRLNHLPPGAACVGRQMCPAASAMRGMRPLTYFPLDLKDSARGTETISRDWGGANTDAFSYQPSDLARPVTLRRGSCISNSADALECVCLLNKSPCVLPDLNTFNDPRRGAVREI